MCASRRRRAPLATDYHEILPNLIVGTQPTTKGDIDRLRDVEGVTCMFDTQQDKDKEYWNVDAGALRWQMEQRDVKHVHMPFVDFNADSLREGLPRAVAAMDKALRDGHKVYCHCTAGMGRAPDTGRGSGRAARRTGTTRTEYRMSTEMYRSQYRLGSDQVGMMYQGGV